MDGEDLKKKLWMVSPKRNKKTSLLSLEPNYVKKNIELFGIFTS